MIINTLIFDFGDVFLNLDKKAVLKNLYDLGLKKFTTEMLKLNEDYEMGVVSTEDFIKKYQDWFPELEKEDFINAWNSILLDFPQHRLEFLKQLAKSKQYKLVLLSNTNDLHIKWIQENIACYQIFKNCFDFFYLSHEIGLRKPNSNSFKYVLDKANCLAQNSLFIDDTPENTLTAKALGIKTWHLNPSSQDVTNLFTINKSHF